MTAGRTLPECQTPSSDVSSDGAWHVRIIAEPDYAPSPIQPPWTKAALRSPVVAVQTRTAHVGECPCDVAARVPRDPAEIARLVGPDIQGGAIQEESQRSRSS